MTQYGVIGAGAVSRSLIARLPAKSEELGPVAAQSFRVASRMVNALHAGTAVRTLEELNPARTILFCSNPSSAQDLAQLLLAARLSWEGKQLILCETVVPPQLFDGLRASGVSVASIQTMGIPGRYLVEGDEAASKTARSIVRKVDGKVIRLGKDRAALFQAGLTLATALLTPRLDFAAQIFRQAGLGDKQAMELAAALFERTARGYGHSGRQSWAYHLRRPDVMKLKEQAVALDAATAAGHGAQFLEELVASFKGFGRHAEEAGLLSPLQKAANG